MRVLRRRGCVVPQPQKRPNSSFIRFEAALPNECWQSDMTHWTLADGSPVEQDRQTHLQQQKWRSDRVEGDEVWVRRHADDVYRPFTPDDEQALHDAFVAHGRERLWDL